METKLISLENEPFDVRNHEYTKFLEFHQNLDLKAVEDIKNITSEYLINNIEQSFFLWENQKWTQQLTFDEFCQYILPYKIFDGQTLDNWKEYLFKKYNNLLANLKYSSVYSNSVYMSCDIINKRLKKDMSPIVLPNNNRPIISLKALSAMTYGPCDAYTSLANAVMQANGIPVGEDFTPQWPFRSLGHSWNFLRENKNNNIVFEGANGTVGMPHKKDHILAKVYRRSFGINRELETIIRHGDAVPPVFSSPFIHDVTDEYLSTIDVEIDVESKRKYIYLAVFDNKNWNILAWGKNNAGRVKFKKLGKGVLYMPVEFNNNNLKYIGDPFIILHNGDIVKVSPDISKKQTLRLERKYPLFGDAYTMNLRKIDAKIQAANNRDFSDSVTLHTFDNLNNELIINESQDSYRYWRFLSADSGFTNVAELKFYNKQNSPLIGEIIGTEGSFFDWDDNKKEAAFDGKLLTFFNSPDADSNWVGMDFKKQVVIKRVTCIMRGDGNDIEIGDEYELNFWNDGQWHSLGRKIANDIALEFDNCPKNALFLLHNRTKGIEERVFTYENGKQVWW
ncbi:hypothetical protein [Parapedobacter sp. 10938]|uniref:hypothetical protein n=1 Tax=Parapedobacter flavus TaxID=3110225 RepID=UPI002DB97C6F|nr:hypothetical protein [Parapedobacter sp. 10938]